MVKEMTVEQVAKQKYESSKSSPCWIIIHNDVYDVTKFLKEHPGGVDALTDYAGKDATRAFEDVGHSDDARELLKKFKIGYLPAEQRNTFIDPCCKVRVTEKDSCKVGVTEKNSCPGLKRRKLDSSGSFRSFDGSSQRSLTPRPSRHHEPRPEPRVVSIVVPRERGGRVLPCDETDEPEPPVSSWSYWWLLGAGVLLLGAAFLAKRKLAA